MRARRVVEQASLTLMLLYLSKYESNIFQSPVYIKSTSTFIMPYNTTAIPPRRDVTGQTQLPCKSHDSRQGHSMLTVTVARVKKIIALDQDIAMCSNNAAFVITIATVSRQSFIVTTKVLTMIRKCLYSIWPSKAIMWSSQSENLDEIYSIETWVRSFL